MRHGNHGYSYKHLLWAFFFLRHYSTEEVASRTCGTTEKTLREKVWALVDLLADLNVISWDQREVGAAPWNQCRVSVDGTDFRIMEQFPFDRKWYSHKYNGPGVRYEVAISIATGWIVWINGPFPCGAWPDLRIARDSLVGILEPGEFYIADGGYYDGYNYAITPTGYHYYSDRVRALIRARHETINRRLKQWKALSHRWRHSIEKHSMAFRAIANIVQIGLLTDKPTWPIHYDKRKFVDRFLMRGA